jgi:glycosyltransferase involved in cell wall biosynthesis
VPSPPRITRLLCVVPYPANTGFAWNYIEGLYAGVADRLAVRGVSTFVAYTAISSPPRSLAGSGAQPVVVDASLGSFSSLRATIGIVRRLRIDALYFTDVATWHWGLPLLRLAGVKWIVSHDHTSGHRDAPRGLKRAVKWIRSRLPGVAADRILTVSEYVATRQREVALAPADRVFPILNGLVLPPERPDRAPLEEIEAGRPLIICACRAAEGKGVDVLLRAFDHLLTEWPDREPRPLLVYIGDGPVMGPLRALRDTLAASDSIRFLGYRQDVERWLRQATICVVPSVWEDACPLSVLEAMALGKPVIASAVGGVPEEINSPDVGLLVPKGDVERLASAMRELLDDGMRREQMGRAARHRIAHELTRESHLAAIVSHFAPA